MGPTPDSDDLKRCTKCGQDKPPAEFSRDRSRRDGRYPQCKACVRRWHQDNAERLAEYNRSMPNGLESCTRRDKLMPD